MLNHTIPLRTSKNAAIQIRASKPISMDVICHSLNLPSIMITCVSEYGLSYGAARVPSGCRIPKLCAVDIFRDFKKSSTNHGRNHKTANYSMLPIIAIDATAAPIVYVMLSPGMIFAGYQLKTKNAARAAAVVNAINEAAIPPTDKA